MPTEKKCAIRAVVGKQHPDIPHAQPHAVCLSPAQYARLFHSQPPVTKLGCGSFACAWEAVDGKAVKITSDKDDVTALLRAQGLPGVIHVDEAFRLPEAGEVRGKTVPLYAVRGERLQPLPAELRPIVTVVTRSDLMAFEYDNWPAGSRRRFRLSADVRRFQEEECEQLKHPARNWPGYAASVETCKRVTRGLGELFEDFARRGIRFRDMHHGNLGVDQHGLIKALDLGHRSSSAVPSALEALAGTRAFAGLGRRWRRRRKRR